MTMIRINLNSLFPALGPLRRLGVVLHCLSQSPIITLLRLRSESAKIINPVSKLVPFLLKKGLICNNPFRSQFHFLGIDVSGDHFT